MVFPDGHWSATLDPTQRLGARDAALSPAFGRQLLPNGHLNVSNVDGVAEAGFSDALVCLRSEAANIRGLPTYVTYAGSLTLAPASPPSPRSPHLMPTSRAPRALSWLLLASTCLTSCATPARDGSDTAEIEASTRRWSELDREARMAVMSTEVMPAARRLFQGFDAERYSSVSCGTCHGEASAARSEYAMPNPSLYPLFPTGTPEQAAMVREHPETVRFMHNHLLPEVQSILGAETYDRETQTGFSCFSCHPRGE